MSVCSVSESPDQPRCKFCGDPIPAGTRRPRQFCDDACRKGAARAEAKDRAETEKATCAHLAEKNSPATESAKSAKNGEKYLSGINDLISGQNGSSAPSLPLERFGRGHRWAGARANGNAAKISAAVNAEIGVGGEWLTSPGGARYQVIPRR